MTHDVAGMIYDIMVVGLLAIGIYLSFRNLKELSQMDRRFDQLGGIKDEQHRKTINGITDILNEVGNDIESDCTTRECVDCKYNTNDGCIVAVLANGVDSLIENIGYDPSEDSEELRKILFKEN